MTAEIKRTHDQDILSNCPVMLIYLIILAYIFNFLYSQATPIWPCLHATIIQYYVIVYIFHFFKCYLLNLIYWVMNSGFEEAHGESISIEKLYFVDRAK